MDDTLCKLCSKNTFKYVCPRCDVEYCSVTCYKAESHSVCSEAFYKESLQEYLKSQEKDQQSNRKMVEVLQRVKEYNENLSVYSSEDSDDCESLSERLKNTNLDDADQVWEKLTDEERQEFIGMVKDGDVSQILTLWEPWWGKTYPTPKVRFVDEAESDIPGFAENCPSVEKEIQLLSNITKVKPSETVFFNLVNVLACYSLVVRYFNGEHAAMACEAALVLITTSKNLSENEVYTSTAVALESVMQEAISCELINTTEDVRQLMREDVIKILRGPNNVKYSFYVQAALSDAYNLLNIYKNSKEKKLIDSKFSKIFPEFKGNIKYPKQTIAKCLQKIKYYQSWCAEYYSPELVNLRMVQL